MRRKTRKTSLQGSVVVSSPVVSVNESVTSLIGMVIFRGISDVGLKVLGGVIVRQMKSCKK